MKGLHSLYYSFIHTFLNYGNLSWGSTNKTNLQKVASRQKQAIRITDSDTVRRTTEKMEKLKNLKSSFANLSYSCLELRETPYHMCFMNSLQTLTISTQLGLVKTT